MPEFIQGFVSSAGKEQNIESDHAKRTWHIGLALYALVNLGNCCFYSLQNKPWRKLMIKILAVVLIFAVSGCAVFDGGKVPKTTLSAYENNGNSKPTLSYSSVAMGGLSSTKELPEAGQSIIEGELLSVLESSNYFGRISKRDESADINIETVLTNSGNPAAMIPAFITGLSLYVIPSWATDNFDLVAKVERQDGLKKEYILADSTTIVQWLPMMFAFPVNNFSVIADVRKNMYKKVLADMKEDGFFMNKEAALSLAK